MVKRKTSYKYLVSGKRSGKPFVRRARTIITAQRLVNRLKVQRIFTDVVASKVQKLK